MTRWDEILSLPVQSPSTSEFSSDDLVWSKVEGWRDNMDRVALIPFTRVDDFLKGESAKEECPLYLRTKPGSYCNDIQYIMEV